MNRQTRNSRRREREDEFAADVDIKKGKGESTNTGGALGQYRRRIANVSKSLLKLLHRTQEVEALLGACDLNFTKKGALARKNKIVTAEKLGGSFFQSMGSANEYGVRVYPDVRSAKHNTELSSGKIQGFSGRFGAL